jgi:hypothetical protein
MTLDEWSRQPLGATSRGKALTALAETYGKPGRDGWSLTEILRLEYRARIRMLDLLNGVARGKVAAQPFAGRFPIRTVSGKPFDLVLVRPDPDDPPALVEAESGVQHHKPNQWVPQTWTIEPESAPPVADNHNPANSAASLLLAWGYGAREGGSEKRRWGDKKAKASGKPPETWLDRWQVYEVAFALRQPKLCPLVDTGTQAGERAARKAA